MASPETALTGGCLCGAIRYSVAAMPKRGMHCHCSLCRRSSGAPYVSWFAISAADFHVTGAAPAHYASSDRAFRQHCPTCGTQLTFQFHSRPEFILVTIGSLDRPEAVKPSEHVFWEDRVPGLIEMDIPVR